MNVAFRSGLHTQTTAMNASGEPDIQTLFKGLKEVHHQMVRDIESAQRQDVLVFRPLAFDEFDIEAFLFEKAFFDSGENGGFARDANVADADSMAVGLRGRTAVLPAT